MSDAVARTKADPNRSRREDQLVAEIERLEALVTEAPKELWLRPGMTPGRWFQSTLPDEPDAVRYVRADLYEAALALAERRMGAVLARAEQEVAGGHMEIRG